MAVNTGYTEMTSSIVMGLGLSSCVVYSSSLLIMNEDPFQYTWMTAQTSTEPCVSNLHLHTGLNNGPYKKEVLEHFSWQNFR